MTKHFVMTTAGHVDHGKSSLVTALTGIDPDRLPEEKARGITIDLGFAHLSIASGPDTFSLGIVDVPGHEDFVKNMVSGVGMVDLALLVVAADDGWMPQTEEHLEILSFLRVKQMLVALTKSDLREDLQPVTREIRERLAHSLFAGSPVLPCSVHEEASIVRLRGALGELLSKATPPPDYGKPRLSVDRVFALKGVGTVVTGTLVGGHFETGEAVVIQPRGLRARIRSMQSHNQTVERAAPGSRVALNLPDVDANPLSEGAVRRGDVLMRPNYGIPSRTVDVLLERSDRASSVKRPGVKQAGRVRLHAGATSVVALVSLANGTELKPGEPGIAQLRTESSIALFRGDRFILRDDSGRVTLAGGVVLDPAGDRKEFRLEKRREFLQREASALEDVEQAIAARLGLDRITPVEAILVNSRFSAEQIRAGLLSLASAGKVALGEKLALTTGEWDRLVRASKESIQAEHREHPEREGIEMAQLARTLGWPEFQPHLTEAICAKLTSLGFARKGGVLRDSRHQAALPPELSAAVKQIRAGLLSKRFDPPARKEIAPDKLRQEALRLMLKDGQAVELNSDLVLLGDAFKEAERIVAAYCKSHGSATVSELRDALGSTRRTIIPLLELFDRRGLTKRVGEKRVWRGRV